jgi:hypothetical protein
MLMFGALNWTSEWFRPRAGRSAQLVADQALDILLHGVQSAKAQAIRASPRRHANGRRPPTKSERRN